MGQWIFARETGRHILEGQDNAIPGRVLLFLNANVAIDHRHYTIAKLQQATVNLWEREAGNGRRTFSWITACVGAEYLSNCLIHSGCTEYSP